MHHTDHKLSKAGVSKLISLGNYFLKMNAAKRYQCYTIPKPLKYKFKLLYTALLKCAENIC